MELNNDVEVFGKDAWVYCSQHLRPHLTGWCNVSAKEKINLEVYGTTQEDHTKAMRKCLDLKLYLCFPENAGG